MLMRRLYQAIGWLLIVFAALCVVLPLLRLVTGDFTFGGVLLGLTLTALFGISGFAVLNFATGPAQAGIHYYGVSEKAEIEKQKSLVRKPPAAAKTPGAAR